MSRKHGPTGNPPKGGPKPTPDEKTPGPGGEHPVSPYLRRPLRRLDEVLRKPGAGERPDDTPPGKNRHEGDSGDE
jgi:hypothetical protein